MQGFRQERAVQKFLQRHAVSHFAGQHHTIGTPCIVTMEQCSQALGPESLQCFISGIGAYHEYFRLPTTVRP